MGIKVFLWLCLGISAVMFITKRSNNTYLRVSSGLKCILSILHALTQSVCKVTLRSWFYHCSNFVAKGR